MLMAAKVRSPVNAFSRSGLRISTDFFDVFSPPADEGRSPGAARSPAAGGSIADNGRVACGLIIQNQWSVISVQWSGNDPETTGEKQIVNRTRLLITDH